MCDGTCKVGRYRYTVTPDAHTSAVTTRPRSARHQRRAPWRGRRARSLESDRGTGYPVFRKFVFAPNRVRPSILEISVEEIEIMRSKLRSSDARITARKVCNFHAMNSSNVCIFSRSRNISKSRTTTLQTANAVARSHISCLATHGSLETRIFAGDEVLARK